MKREEKRFRAEINDNNGHTYVHYSDTLRGLERTLSRYYSKESGLLFGDYYNAGGPRYYHNKSNREIDPLAVSWFLH